MSNSCYVPGCRSGYKTDKKRNREIGVKNPTLFKAPNDPCRLAQWAAAIDRTDRPLGPKECVCELHFLESDIDRYFETKLPGGVIHKIPRTVLRLKAHAIPSIFPQFASAECRIRKKRKACAPNNSKGRERRTSLEREQSPELMISGDEGKYPFPKGQSDADMVSDPFDFQMLVKEAHKIVLPSDMWTVGVLKGNQVIFVNWSDGETVEAKKKVLIDEQLHVKIVFGNVTLSLENIREVHGVEEVVTFLIVIDQLNICEGTENEHNSRSEACIGYTLPRNLTQEGATSPRCHHCRKARKHTVSLRRKKVTANALEKQSKLCKESMEPNWKRNLLPKKGGKLSLDVGPPVCAVDEAVVRCGVGADSSAVRGAVVKEEEVDIEEWTPPPNWDSLPSPTSSQPPPPPTNIGRHSAVAVEPLDAERLVVEAHRIPLPSDAWTLGVLRGRRLVFARWTDGEVLEAEKRMVIDENLNVKVILGSRILTLDDIKEVHDIGDVGHYLYIVDHLRKCKGLGTGWSADSCPGYFVPGPMAGMRSCALRCAFCQGAQEELSRIRRVRRKLGGGGGKARAQAQGKVWRNLKKLSDVFPELKNGPKDSLS